VGLSVVEPCEAFPLPPGKRLVPDYLCLNGHKMIDMREEPRFREAAAEAERQGRTLLRHDRLFVLWEAARNTRRVEGAAAEVGTYRGGSARFLAEAMRAHGVRRTLHAFDTFCGHPAIVDAGRDGLHTAGYLGDTSLEAVREYLATHPEIVLHAGQFADTRAEVEGETFGLVHVDVDLYESALQSLEFFWPRLAPQGVLVVDDYGFRTCRGLKEAVDGFVANRADCSRWYMNTGQLVLRRLP